MVLSSLSGLPAFAIYFFTALAMCVLFVLIYTRVTPYNEFDLILKEHNASAAIALGMSLLGFSLPLASAIFNSVDIVDCVVWAVIALITQLLAYGVAWFSHPNLGEAIRNNTMAAALWVGFVSLAAGLLNAASMTY
jgi:putative membrane protein